MGKKTTQEDKDFLGRYLWEKVDKTPCCWVWTGATHKNRARMHVPRGIVDLPPTAPPHYVAWFLELGRVPQRGELMRLCDDPMCVRPSHYRRRSYQRKPGTAKSGPKPPAPTETIVQSAPSKLEQASYAMLVALTKELRGYIAGQAEHSANPAAACTADKRLDIVASELAALRVAIEQRDASSTTTGQLDRIEQGLAALSQAAELQSAATERALARVATPTPVAPEPARPAAADAQPNRSLRGLLCEAFTAHTGAAVEPESDGANLLEAVFDIALRGCEGDTQRSSTTFRAWLRWYGTLVHSGAEPSPAAMLAAVRDRTRGRPSAQ